MRVHLSVCSRLGVLIALGMPGASATAQIITFEQLPDGTPPIDDGFLPITAPYTVDGIEIRMGWDTDSDGVIDTPAQFERAGSSAGEQQVAFLNNDLDVFDAPDAEYAEQLGTFFLRRSAGIVREDRFVITYSVPVPGVSGEIWDIDCDSATSECEQWVVRIYDELGALLGETASPLLSCDPSCEDVNGFDAEPWFFSLANGAGIARVEFSYTGTTSVPVGPFAFNNFNAVAPIPGPTLLAHEPAHADTAAAGVGFAELYWSEPVLIGASDISVTEQGTGLAVPFELSGSGGQVTRVVFTGEPGGPDLGVQTPARNRAYTVTVQGQARAVSNNAPIDGDGDGFAGGAAEVGVVSTCTVDSAPPFGVLDLSDINAFVTDFVNGCE